MVKKQKVGEIEQIVVRLPKMYVEKMDALIAKGYYSSRSEVVRDALRMLFRESI